jgi:thymidylate synthase (FAD)
LQAELIAFTQPNPALSAQAVAGLGDLPAIWQGQGTYAENLIEYAGRVCYHSTHRMGSAADFIADRVREGHEDIIEHIVVTVRLHAADADAEGGDAAHPAAWRLYNRHCEVSDLGGGGWLVSGNTRVWLDLFRRGLALAALPLVRGVAPAVFADLPGADQAVPPAPLAAPLAVAPAAPAGPALLPSTDGPLRVTLLGYTQPQLADVTLAAAHGSATFFFEGISRTCTHQLVRHRLASFSQESQRYVDLSKGEWNAIIPPAVQANPAALAEMADFWRLAEEKYARLRALGIRKEDARFLLPNAAETRIIATMNFDAWGHFLWLRAVDKAAQWEIRLMGQRALAMLHAIAPAPFAEQWRVYQEQFGGRG